MKIKTIDGCDLYRDGGSYGLMFTGDDGKYYELFIQTTVFKKHPDTAYEFPVIYINDCNGDVLKTLSWNEARDLLDGWNRCDPDCDDRFQEFRKILESEGRHI